MRLLVIDDMPADAELIRFELQRSGVESHCAIAESQDQFIRELESNPPDVILSDHGVPGFDGYSALAIARQKLPRVPFLFVTGTEGLPTTPGARWKADGSVSKTDLRQLVPAIEKALEEASRRESEAPCPISDREETRALATALGREMIERGCELEGQLDRLREPGNLATEIPPLLENARSMQKLAEQLFLLASEHPTALSLPPIAVASIVKSAMQQVLQSNLDRRINWRIRPLPAFNADPVILPLVVGSLLDLALALTRKQRIPSIEFGAATGSDEALIWIEYQGGPGTIPLRDSQILLQAPCQIDVQETETSAPAILARRLARRLSGRTWAEPRQDGGARLFCAFPLAEQKCSPGDEADGLPAS